LKYRKLEPTLERPISNEVSSFFNIAHAESYFTSKTPMKREKEKGEIKQNEKNSSLGFCSNSAKFNAAIEHFLCTGYHPANRIYYYQRWGFIHFFHLGDFNFDLC
jgi:hypothetical protein